jgi:signal transduction histidine kinase
LADDDGRSWTASIPEHLVAPARISTEEAAAAIDALVGNVFAHTGEGTPYAINVTVDALTVALTVEDGGTGIAAPDAVLERGATGGGSTGLGLDIARKAAEAASGSLSISRSPLGGAAVTLRLPR